MLTFTSYCDIKDEDGMYFDPDSISLSIYDPDNNLIASNLVPYKLSTGLYLYDYEFPENPKPGIWILRWKVIVAGAVIDGNTDDYFSVLNPDSICNCSIKMNPDGNLNEKTSSTVAINFTEQSTSRPIIPEKVRYSVHDVASGEIIINETELSALTPKGVILELSREHNRILNNTNPLETRNITVEYDYRDLEGNLTRGASEEHEYSVVNLEFVGDD